MTKILLVGQGIAGTLLAWELKKRGAEAHIAEGNLEGSSSVAAAGIINPVTGKRFVKSWRFDEFFPQAKATYQAMEQALGIRIWEERPILRLLGSPEESNDWSIRCAQPEYAQQLGECPDAGAWSPFLKPGFRFGHIHQAARANLPLLVSNYRQYAQKAGVFVDQRVDFQNIDVLLSKYDRIVFCEGWRAASNPFFPETPFRVSKGEALLLRFPGVDMADLPTDMLKKTLLLAPMGDGTFWAGSTYRWHFEDSKPSPEGRDYILGYLREMFEHPFEIVDHVAGIRPTMVDRRPVLEQSKIHPKLFMFNGLGTKGALLAPFFAKQLAAELF